MPTITYSLAFTLIPETLEGGYARYTSQELPGFRVLCEPNENPIPLFESALQAFLPPLIQAAEKRKIVLQTLRIKTPAAIFERRPAPVHMEADYAAAA
jgi:hypothetical protein